MKVCMVVPNGEVKGGIASVVNGYRGSCLEKEHRLTYVESYCDGSKLRKLLKGIGGYLHFAWVLLTDRPELVHIHSSFGPSFYRKLPFLYMADWAGIPVVNHIHGAQWEPFYEAASEKKKRRIQRAYGKCSALIALSQEWKQLLSQAVSSERIHVIENYSMPREDALQARLQRQSGHTVLFLGELGRRKGCYDIPAAAARVAGEIPDVRFVLAGAGTAEDETALRQLCRDWGVEANVTFPGWVRGEEKDRLLREADVFFLPSYNEGMPMSVLDAMGYGLPVVSTRVGGIPQLVRDGENGCCLLPGDTARMGSELAALLKDRARQTVYGRQSYRIADREYGIQAHLQKLSALYAQVLQGYYHGE